MTIRPFDDYLGAVLLRGFSRGFNPEFDPSRKVRRVLEPRILALLAGPAAEARHRAGRRNLIGAADDYRKVLDYALWIVGAPEPASAYIKWLAIEAKGLVAEQRTWTAIGALAGALLDRETLDFDAARRVIEAANPPKSAQVVQGVVLGTDGEKQEKTIPLNGFPIVPRWNWYRNW